jgi:hypothetical protein
MHGKPGVFRKKPFPNHSPDGRYAAILRDNSQYSLHLLQFLRYACFQTISMGAAGPESITRRAAMPAGLISGL